MILTAKPLPLGLAQGLILVLLLASSPLSAGGSDQWSRFRGPNGQGTGVESKLPTLFGPTTNVAWKTELPPGHSSPILSEKLILLTAVDGERLLTIALDRGNGKEVWRALAPRPRLEKLDNRNGPAAASPATDGQAVYVFFGDYGLIAYDLLGKELWKKPLGPFDNVYGMGASPIVVEDRVLFAADQQTGSYLLALDKQSGKTLWRAERPEAKSGHSTPILYRPKTGPPQVLLPGSFFLSAYDVEGGDRLWWIRGLSFEMKSTPALSGNTLYVNGYGSQFNDPGQKQEIGGFAQMLEQRDADHNGKLSSEEVPDGLPKQWFGFVDLDGDDALDAADWDYFEAALSTRNSMMAIRLPEQKRGDLSKTHVAWQYFEKVPQLPSPLLYRGVLYMISDRGIVTTFRPETGEVIRQGRIPGAIDSYYASPVASDGKVIFCGRAGKVAVLPADGELNPLAVNDLDDQITATPAIADDRLLVRTKGALYAFGR